jgi:hypothetical protein
LPIAAAIFRHPSQICASVVGGNSHIRFLNGLNVIYLVGLHQNDFIIIIVRRRLTFEPQLLPELPLVVRKLFLDQYFRLIGKLVSMGLRALD